MVSINERFYKNRIALNVLANSIQNAKEIYTAAEGYVLVGILSNQYSSVEEAAKEMREYGNAINHAVSIGLGSGDSRQAKVVAEIVKFYSGCHINQVFPTVGQTRANLKQGSWVNSLVSPSGQTGFVNISTGFISSQSDQKAIVPVKTAISLVRDMGGDSLKYFPVKGLENMEEFIAVAKACGEEEFALEPTGGINKINFETIISICLENNVPKVIPHIYSSVIDEKTGNTNIEDVHYLLDITKKVVDDNG